MYDEAKMSVKCMPKETEDFIMKIDIQKDLYLFHW